LHVGGTPGLRADRTNERRRVKSARTDLHVERLQDEAPLLRPVILQGLDQPLETGQVAVGCFAHLVRWPKGVIITKAFFLLMHFPLLLHHLVVLRFQAVMMAAMQNILGQWLYSIKHYLLMCLFLSSPERLPYSPWSLLLTGLVYFLLGMQLINAERSYAEVCAQIILELLMMGLIAWVMLHWKQALTRLLQTYSALLGITVAFTALTIPIYRLAISDGEVENSSLTLLILGLQIWNLAVMSLIFKRSFEISTQLSAIIAFGYFVVYHIVFYWLFV
jgi:hypothetical protein